MSLIEDYVQFEATLSEHGMTETGREYKQTHLKLVPCSVDDFYPAHEGAQW